MDNADMKRTRKKVLMALAFAAVFSSTMVIGCSPSATTDPSGHDKPIQNASVGKDSPAADGPWSADSDCVACHADQSATANDTSTNHFLHASLECIACHTDDDGGLSEGHKEYASGKLPKKLKDSTVSDELCLSCHSRTEIESATSSSTALTDENGKTVNPHSIPETDSNSHSDIACIDCHRVHEISSTPTEEAAQLCKTCHHENVYECGTCHS